MSSSSGAAEAAASRLVVGTAALGMAYGLPQLTGRAQSELTQDEAEGIVKEALACGLRIFDTATDYGLAEERIGRALAGAGIVWTKIGASTNAGRDPAGPAKSALGASLARLKRDRIDLLQWHNWNRELLDAPSFVTAWEALSNDVRCRALGASTYGPDDAVAAVESGLFKVVQVEWNLLNQTAVRAAASSARRLGVKLAARTVLLQGVLTDRGQNMPLHLAPLVPWRDRAAALATSLGMNLATLSLRAAIEHPDLSYVLVGLDARGQACQHIAAATFVSPALPWEKIEELHADCALTDPRRWSHAAH